MNSGIKWVAKIPQGIDANSEDLQDELEEYVIGTGFYLTFQFQTKLLKSYQTWFQSKGVDAGRKYFQMYVRQDDRFPKVSQQQQNRTIAEMSNLYAQAKKNCWVEQRLTDHGVGFADQTPAKCPQCDATFPFSELSSHINRCGM
jgi:hypothetical protein